MSTRNSLFLTTLVGEFVEILATYETSAKMPLVIHGYLLDMDDDFYYIGNNPLEVRSVVKKDHVTFIEIMQTVDTNTAMLEEMPVPVKEEESN